MEFITVIIMRNDYAKEDNYSWRQNGEEHCTLFGQWDKGLARSYPGADTGTKPYFSLSWTWKQNVSQPPPEFIDQTTRNSLTKLVNLPFLLEKVEIAVYCLKKGKSFDTENIPDELLKQDGKETTKALTEIIWECKNCPQRRKPLAYMERKIYASENMPEEDATNTECETKDFI